VLVEDELWAVVEPLIPRVPRRRVRPGRPRMDNRAVLNGILFRAAHRHRGRLLPQELGFGSGVTRWWMPLPPLLFRPAPSSLAGHGRI